MSILPLTIPECSRDRSSVRKTPVWQRAARGRSSGRWGISPSPRLSSGQLHPQERSLQLLPGRSQSPHLRIQDTVLPCLFEYCVAGLMIMHILRQNANTSLPTIKGPHDLISAGKHFYKTDIIFDG